jgi:hypothetical protein
MKSSLRDLSIKRHEIVNFNTCGLVNMLSSSSLRSKVWKFGNFRFAFNLSRSYALGTSPSQPFIQDKVVWEEVYFASNTT